MITDIIQGCPTKLNGDLKGINDLRQRRDDLYQFLEKSPLANKNVNKAESETMLIELIGINIAAIMGDKAALVAKYIPIILYKIERIKISIMTSLPFLA